MQICATQLAACHVPVTYLLVLGVLGALLGIANVELQLGPFLHMEGARDIWCMQKMGAEMRHGQSGENPIRAALANTWFLPYIVKLEEKEPK
jgi:hypothetical protein